MKQFLVVTRLGFVASLAWLASGCGGSSAADPCPNGICPRDASVARDTGPLPDTGPRPDTGVPEDAYVPPPIDGCVEAWSCTPWVTDGSSDTATRTCDDASHCGTTTTMPVTTTTLPALDPDYFECNVQPILDRDCSMLGCHGTDAGRALRLYARGRHRLGTGTYTEPACGTQRGMSFPWSHCEGSIECGCASLPRRPAEHRANFDSARSFALGPDGAPLADPSTSDLVRQPLYGGGLSHQNAHFWSTTDADYTTILGWLGGASLGHACNSGT